MYLATIQYDGHGFGEIRTSVMPQTETNIIKVQQCDLYALATLAADVLGECQPYLVPYAMGNLAKWIIRYGARKYGPRMMLYQTARALAVHQTREHYEQRKR